MFTVKVNISDTDTILTKHGLEPGGRVQRFITNEIMRLSNPYVPNDGAGILASSARISNEGDAIIYATPYARYHWYGKLMVDPKTGKGAFYKEGYGFWSRKGVQKVLTDRDMKYQGAPLRGPRWVERAWLDNKQSIIKATEQYARSIK